jgi:hypothetical protein
MLYNKTGDIKAAIAFVKFDKTTRSTGKALPHCTKVILKRKVYSLFLKKYPLMSIVPWILKA